MQTRSQFCGACMASNVFAAQSLQHLVHLTASRHKSLKFRMRFIQSLQTTGNSNALKVFQKTQCRLLLGLLLEILRFVRQYVVTSLGKPSPVILLGHGVHTHVLQETAGPGARRPGIHLNSITGPQELVWWQDDSW